jgi:hypothetical protein
MTLAYHTPYFSFIPSKRKRREENFYLETEVLLPFFLHNFAYKKHQIR